jgi:CHAT domain-containing protein
VAFPPPNDIPISRLTAVAASYGLGTDLSKLQHALDEQKMLQTGRQARPLQANRAALQVLVTEAKTAGHLIHFAVHGLSDPDANDQALLLDDKTRLLPSALAGRFRCGDTPAFAFVFLNACQVGTAASCLGQAAGFPGDLIRGGTLGFLAPLWDVDDEVARAFAERFYAATLDEHQTVGEVLAAERANYAAEGSTTPMAYIYYGHPNLRLTRAA